MGIMRVEEEVLGVVVVGGSTAAILAVPLLAEIGVGGSGPEVGGDPDFRTGEWLLLFRSSDGLLAMAAWGTRFRLFLAVSKGLSAGEIGLTTASLASSTTTAAGLVSTASCTALELHLP